MRRLRLGCVLESSAPPTLQAVDPIENAGGPPATRACEPLAVAAKHRGCVGVGHKQSGELTLVVAAPCARDNAQLVEPTVVVPPRYGLDAATHDGIEQPHALQIVSIHGKSARSRPPGFSTRLTSPSSRLWVSRATKLNLATLLSVQVSRCPVLCGAVMPIHEDENRVDDEPNNDDGQQAPARSLDQTD